MIVQGGEKMKQLYDGEDRIYMIFHGEDLIYNCYAIPETITYNLNCGNTNKRTGNVKSNTEWIIK